MKPKSAPYNLAYIAICVLVGVVAILIRARAALNDLWLDEIWSIELVRELHSAIGVFTQTHHDNNHYLNSLFIYFLGQRGNWSGYRILSELAGIGTVILAWFIGTRQGKATAFFSMLVVAFSYVLILYSSEARGYASLILFCFACFLVLRSFLEESRWQSAALFSLAAVLGLTSHLTFLVFIAGSLPWFCLRLHKRGFSIPTIALWTLGCYGAALVELLALYFIDLRYLQIGGGTPLTVFDGYRATLAWTLGGPNAPQLQHFTVVACVIIFITGLAVLIRERSDVWLFYVGTIVVAPLAMALIDRGTLHYVRYFIAALGFLLLLFGRVLGWLFERRRLGRIAACAVCAAFIALNGWSTAALMRFGRGHITDAIQFMVNQSRSPKEISFGGEQDFRTQFILGFYWRVMMGGKPAAYYDHDHWPFAGPEWVIFHGESFREPVPSGKRFTDKFDNPYELVRIFPTAPLSGVHLFIYREISRR